MKNNLVLRPQKIFICSAKHLADSFKKTFYACANWDVRTLVILPMSFFEIEQRKDGERK